MKIPTAINNTAVRLFSNVKLTWPSRPEREWCAREESCYNSQLQKTLRKVVSSGRVVSGTRDHIDRA